MISFDNRDCGLSSKLHGQGLELVTAITAAASAGNFQKARALAAYTLSEMADDGLGAADGARHRTGACAGFLDGRNDRSDDGVEHPERLLTLTSMMSTTGEPEFGRSTPQARQALLTPAPADRAGYVDAAERSLIWRSKRYPDLLGARQLAGDSYDRCYYPEGSTRQLAAMIASGSRAPGLRGVQIPTLVMHGLDDTLIAPSGGERTAALIPGARLLLINDMGHDRPEPLWPQICEAILKHTD